MLSDGLSSKEIGKELWLVEDTIKQHRKSIHRKLLAKNGANAIAIAFRNGLIS